MLVKRPLKPKAWDAVFEDFYRLFWGLLNLLAALISTER